MSNRHLALLGAIAALAGGTLAHADVFTYTNTSGSTTSWETAGNWTVAGSSGRTYPNSTADELVFSQNNTNWGYLSFNWGANTVRTVGKITFSTNNYLWIDGNTNNSYDAYKLVFDNGTAGGTFELLAGGSTNTTSGSNFLIFGGSASNKKMTLQLNQNVNIKYNSSNTSQSSTIGFQSYAKITGGSAAAPVNMTITGNQTSGSGVLYVVTNCVDTNFVGNWVIQNNKAVLRHTYNAAGDAFGSATNKIILENGGRLNLIVASSGATYTLSRDISGTGTVFTGLSSNNNDSAHAALLLKQKTLSPGANAGDIGTLNIAASTVTLDGTLTTVIDLASASSFDTLSVTGALVLGGTLNLNALYSPINGQSWVIATATGGISGSFSNTLAEGYALNAAGNDLVLSYTAVPEISAIMPLALGSLSLLWRRRK